jgi:DNA-binding GntR family transcriptional regulator
LPNDQVRNGTPPRDQAVGDGAAAKKIARELVADIISGRLPPGTQLREVSLTEKYGTGRYTIRSALRELEIAGLAESRRFAGYRVKALTRDDVKDIFAVRLLIETEAARRAMDRPETWPAIRKRIDELEQLEALHIESNMAGDDRFNAASLEADLAVHLAVVEASGSPRLAAAYSPLLSELRLCLSWIALTNTSFRPGQHAELLMAIQSGDAVHVASAFRIHISDGLKDALAQIQK